VVSLTVASSMRSSTDIVASETDLHVYSISFSTSRTSAVIISARSPGLGLEKSFVYITGKILQENYCVLLSSRQAQHQC